MQLDDYMSGLCLKLDIHGYEDRAKRLKYLYEILRGKLSKKVIQFTTLQVKFTNHYHATHSVFFSLLGKCF